MRNHRAYEVGDQVLRGITVYDVVEIDDDGTVWAATNDYEETIEVSDDTDDFLGVIGRDR